VNSIAKASLAGASGVALPAEELSEATLAELVHACHALDMEPFVEVINAGHTRSSLFAIQLLFCCCCECDDLHAKISPSTAQLRAAVYEAMVCAADLGQEACVGSRGGGCAHHLHPLHLKRFDPAPASLLRC
jgi:hypothetical protein